ncbi:MAG: inositol monophosphatase family protein [Chloroflexota bacterium]|nr:inositol monophosphatase [Dehalococcoidia bacterium]MDW8253505.1 inositol monophosphatase family protein [Chloroflexota bacterium]
MNPLAIALDAAAAAAERLLALRGRISEYATKVNRTDLVSEADLTAERTIVEIIRRHAPRHVIVAEEGAGGGDDDTHRWYIDPLDGTTNYLHGHPFFAVSIAYARRGELVAAVVHAPALGEVFAAERGAGATLNGRQIAVSSTPDLSSAMLATGFAYTLPERLANVSLWRAFLERALALRRDGAAAIDLAYVAAGRFDGYWEWPLNAWDVAAGLLLVEEAGGVVTNYRGGPIDLSRPATVASNGRIHAALLAVIAETLPAMPVAP